MNRMVRLAYFRQVLQTDDNIVFVPEANNNNAAVAQVGCSMIIEGTISEYMKNPRNSYART
ncbi:hypothetical protein ASG25_03010 [Rhizobium sp. Leaf384]|nr:hypothetical protein ASG25_03010 [Rhizobium sp. Leaf384]